MQNAFYKMLDNGPGPPQLRGNETTQVKGGIMRKTLLGTVAAVLMAGMTLFNQPAEAAMIGKNSPSW
jgi:hypothetical protein